jgi:hypothetical protein
VDAELSLESGKATLMTVLLISLTLFALDCSDSRDLRLADKYRRQAPNEIGMRIKGRVLVNLIHSGMSREEVESLLGKNFLCAFTLIGGRTSAVTYYQRLRICVSFITGDDGVLRVERLELSPD